MKIRPSNSYLLITVLVVVTIAGCSSRAGDSKITVSGHVQTGAAVLRDRGFDLLDGKRVGLITNQTAVVDSVHLIDLLHDAANVNLVALFGPEHGLRGQAEAGASVSDDVDTATGLPIYSLYGSSDAPSDEVLAELDVLVFDIQDIGARFYTYISTMGRSMQVAARANIPFIVLDRPNPLGGENVAGYVLEPEYVSGVGLYAIPVQHGLTVGELARMIVGESLLSDVDSLDLSVVEMTDWSRSMLWPETGLPWIATSPNIPTFETALVYAGTCFFEAMSASEGRGTLTPFLKLGAPWIDAEAAVSAMTSLALPGVRFSAGQTKPMTIPSMAVHPKFEDQMISTVRIDVTDANAFMPVKTGVAALRVFYDLAPDSISSDQINERWMALLSGSTRLTSGLETGQSVDEIVASWTDEVSAFRASRSAYLLYD